MTRTAIVTGAGSGIGAATARRFSADGCNVVLFATTREKLDHVAADLPQDRTLVIAGDVTSSADIDTLIAQTVERFGGIDVLVANAGIARAGKAGELEPKALREVLEVNVEGTHAVIRAALPHLKAAKGAIVTTSSVSGMGGDWGMFAYNASKGGVSLMTMAMAMDLAPDVRVNAVAPTFTKSEMTTGIQDNPELLDKFAERIPMGRGAEPEEIADVIAFLAGHDARFVTGVVLPVDGGLSASNGQPRQA